MYLIYFPDRDSYLRDWSLDFRTVRFTTCEFERDARKFYDLSLGESIFRLIQRDELVCLCYVPA